MTHYWTLLVKQVCKATHVNLGWFQYRIEHYSAFNALTCSGVRAGMFSCSVSHWNISVTRLRDNTKKKLQHDRSDDRTHFDDVTVTFSVKHIYITNKNFNIEK